MKIKTQGKETEHKSAVTCKRHVRFVIEELRFVELLEESDWNFQEGRGRRQRGQWEGEGRPGETGEETHTSFCSVEGDYPADGREDGQ